MGKFKRTVTFKEVTVAESGTTRLGYEVVKLRNTTRFYIGEVLNDDAVESLIRNDYDITITK